MTQAAFNEPFAGGDPAVPVAGARGARQFLCLARIVNFVALRRSFGRARAARLTDEMLDRLAGLTSTIQLGTIDQQTIEIGWSGVDRDEIDAMIALMTERFAAPIMVDGRPYQLDIAIGAATAHRLAPDDVRLLEAAEASLADRRVDQAVEVRDATGIDAEPGQAALARELPAAIRCGQLRLHYQPKVHLRRQEVASVEALIRWQHPEHGLIPPNDFIPLAEELRLIDAMTLWTMRQVITDQALMRARGYDPTIYINVSGQLLSDARFVHDARNLVRDHGVNIGFEVTETSVIRDPQSAIANLNTFADAGITIAIDDYGAGLSSLAYLKQLPARELKIDKLFVTQLASSNRDPLIVRSTIDLAHALEMEVVAEGVETAAALALLTVMGCDMAQGFLISRPVPLDALLLYLDSEQYRDLPREDRARFGRLVGGPTRAAG